MSESVVSRRVQRNRCLSEAKDTDYYAQKYKIYRMKQSQPLSPQHLSSLHLPLIKTNISSQRHSHRNLTKSRSKPSALGSLSHCLLVIKQQKIHMSPRLKSLLKQFNERRQNLQYIAELSVELREYNPLFRKLCQLVSCCILRNSTIRKYQKGSYIYNKGDESQEFFIILDGRVLIYNKKDHFRKICKPGETLSQEVALNLSQEELDYEKGKLQYAKSASKTILLQVRVGLYSKLYAQCSARGHKYKILTLQNVLMRNYLNKASIRKTGFV